MEPGTVTAGPIGSSAGKDYPPTIRQDLVLVCGVDHPVMHEVGEALPSALRGAFSAQGTPLEPRDVEHAFVEVVRITGDVTALAPRDDLAPNVFGALLAAVAA